MTGSPNLQSKARQFYLGLMYYSSDGVPQDYNLGSPNLQRCMQYNLGNCRRVPQDDKQAVHWFTKSAEQGDADAQYNLGLMYAEGDGVPQDDKQAVHWFTKSAEQGDAGAQFSLGVMYAEGRRRSAR